MSTSDSDPHAQPPSTAEPRARTVSGRRVAVALVAIVALVGFGAWLLRRLVLDGAG